MEKSCGAIIFNEGKVLVVKQTSGFYGFPKGHVEIGETEKETAIREVKEETGLDIKIISDKRYTQSYIVKENVHKDVVFFIAKLENNNEKRQVEEIEEILWIDINEVENILTYDSLKELWKEVKKDFLVL
ncbi:MAG: NUDIX domain-containing protein [Bacilli bacterium]|nr:NUDIX domain-containing protein [Bacilli bacterium]